MTQQARQRTMYPIASRTRPAETIGTQQVSKNPDPISHHNPANVG